MGNKSLLLEPTDFFASAVDEALKNRRVTSSPLAYEYLVKLLTHYITTENLFDETSESGRRTRSILAELYLKAMNAEPANRIELLKKLGDTSLYISGFFG